MTHQTVEESNRQLGQRADIEIDHRQVPVARKRGRPAQKPKPALLATNCGWTPRAASSAASGTRRRAFRDRDRVRLAAICRRLRPPPPARRVRSARGATSTSSCPYATSTRASSAPMPADAPVISAIGLTRRNRPLVWRCAAAAQYAPAPTRREDRRRARASYPRARRAGRRRRRSPTSFRRHGRDLPRRGRG